MTDMNISKASLTTDGSSIRFSLPISKVDVERRVVSGFATTDAVDKQSDIVTAEASIKAFAKFRGNIREMHQPTAVGKMVSFKEDKYFDPQSKKFYEGVYVSAYISKGAQDTWEKVLDGTLSGFSIGGKMNKWDEAYDEKMDRTIRVIKEYDLVELSLVDNPANQFANIMSIEKVDGVDMVKGDLVNTEIENVFWDDENGIVMVSKDDSVSSPLSGSPMKNIGFVETNDSEKAEMIKFLVDSAKGINLSKMNKEGDPMTDATESVVEKNDDVVEDAQVAPEADAVSETAEVAVEAEAPTAEAVVEDVEKSETVEEETSEKSDSSDAEVEVAEVSKADDVVANAISEIKDDITSAFSDLSAVVKSLGEEIAELKKSLGVVSQDVASVKSDVNSTKNDVTEFGKRVQAVEADTAFRKSGDLGEIVQEAQIEKSERSLWGGRFLKTADLFR
jgi:hypothetical protein